MLSYNELPLYCSTLPSGFHADTGCFSQCAVCVVKVLFCRRDSMLTLGFSVDDAVLYCHYGSILPSRFYADIGVIG